MKTNKKSWRHVGDLQGRSLVEILIALTIGMVILAAVSSLFFGNRQTFRANDDKTRLDEEGRLALNLMAFHIRMAGYGTLLTHDEGYSNTTAAKLNRVQPATYTSASDIAGTAANAIVGCANGFADSGAAVVACQAGNVSDAFAVSYDVDQHIVGLGSALPTDCLGAVIRLSPAIPPVNKRSGTAEFYRVENRFFVQNNAVTGNPELYCRGNGNTPPGAPFANVAQPIAENVETMKITYGLSPAEAILDAPGNENGEKASVQSVNQFLTADLMTPADWPRVVSVRLCIVVRSANDFVVTQRQAYRDCNDAQVVAADRRMRGVFSTTIAIRSRSVGAT